MKLRVSRGGGAVALMAVLLLPRPLVALGLPTVLNFAHFAIVPIGTVLMLYGTNWFRRLRGVTIALSCLCVVSGLSALINGAGLINAALLTLMLCEPFLLAMAVLSGTWNRRDERSVGAGVAGLLALHVILVLVDYVQSNGNPDRVEGLFTGMGAGAHLAGATGLLLGLWMFLDSKSYPKLLRAVGLGLGLTVAILTDSKQAVVAVLAATAIMAVLQFRSAGRTLRAGALTTTLAAVVLVFGARLYGGAPVWLSAEAITSGIAQKSTVFTTLAERADGPLSVMFGLGPGHTVTRLGTMLPTYYGWLRPLGATQSELTGTLWAASEAHPLSNHLTGSSAFSLQFSWAGIIGDIGVLGTGLYVLLWVWLWVVGRRDLWSGMAILSACALGLAFSWLEEPAFTGLVAGGVAIRNRSEQPPPATDGEECRQPVRGREGLVSQESQILPRDTNR